MIAVTPLSYPRSGNWLADTDERNKPVYQSRRYYTPGRVFAICKFPMQPYWAIRSTMELELCRGELFDAFIESGLQGATFQRRKDALAALTVWLATVDGNAVG